MTVAQWNPFETLSTLQEEVDRLFDRRLSPARSRSTDLAPSSWVPSVDIHEDKEALVFDVEVPGMKKEDLDLNIENGVLTIRGDKKREAEVKERNYYRAEREYGVFTRSFTLPDTADSEKVAAEYQNGVLRVKIAKREAAKPKKIQIQLNS